MEFIDLNKQRSLIAQDLETRIEKVLSHGKFILGPEVAELEQRLARFVGVKHCIGVANGTDALQIAMMALDITPGDEIITTPFSFFATVETILVLGAKPVFVDIDPETYNINANLIESAVTKKTKAIIPVSLYGQCADMDKINEVAKKHSLAVIEDAAQSFGATYKEKKSCGLSTIGCTSFFPSKPLGCYGDGGACFTSDDSLGEKIRQVRAHGQDKRYHHVILGLNSRLDTLQAAILLSKMELFEKEIQLRRKIGAQYSDRLKEYVETPRVESWNTHVYAQYTIRVKNRAALQKTLESQKVPTSVHYPLGLHQQPALKKLGFAETSFPETERAAETVLSIPMHPYLSEEDQNKVVRALKEGLSTQ